MKTNRSNHSLIVIGVMVGVLSGCGSGGDSTSGAAPSAVSATPAVSAPSPVVPAPTPAAPAPAAPTPAAPTPAAPTPAAPTPAAPTPAAPAPSGPRALGVMELTVFGPGGASLKSAAGSGLDLAQASKGSIDIAVNGVAMRQITTTYRVRNAAFCATIGSCPANNYALKNLRIVGVASNDTIAQTAITRMRRFDGSAASSAIASLITPTFGIDGLGNSLPASESSLIQYGASNIPAAQAGVSQVLNFGYAAVRIDGVGTRELSANPAANQFDGLLRITIAVPVQAQAGADPFEIGMLFELEADAD